MPVRRIDHVLIAMPAGREEAARAFYRDMLGFTEKENRRSLPCAAAAGSRAAE